MKLEWLILGYNQSLFSSVTSSYASLSQRLTGLASFLVYLENIIAQVNTRGPVQQLTSASHPYFVFPDLALLKLVSRFCSYETQNQSMGWK